MNPKTQGSHQTVRDFTIYPLLLAWDSKFVGGNFEKGTSRSIKIHTELLSKIRRTGQHRDYEREEMEVGLQPSTIMPPLVIVAASGPVSHDGSRVERFCEVLYYISRSLRSTSMHRIMPRSEVSIVQCKRAATAQIRMSTAPH